MPQGERRRASAAEFVGFLVAAAQAAGSLTLAALIAHGDNGAATDTSATFLIGVGVVFAVLGVVVGASALLTLRQSLAARFALVGSEVVLGGVGFAFVQIVGVFITATSVVVILLVTVLSGIGRPKTPRSVTRPVG